MDELDEAAFADFYRRTARPLWAYVFRAIGHAADADDIVQEAFVRLLRRPAAGQGRRPNLSNDDQRRRYLFRVASNLVVDRWRTQQRSPQHDESRLDDIAAPAPAGHTNVISLFNRLASRDRALLWLAYVEGESHEEMAASLGVGRLSIKVLLHRARGRLRKLLTVRDVVAGE